jgi:hypothetical protein
MGKIVLRIRPAEVMEDIDLAFLRHRMKQLAGWESELQDTRLSDAPYVSVVMQVTAIDAAALARLKAAFAGLPKMRALIVLSVGVELPLDAIGVDQLRAAARWP